MSWMRQGIAAAETEVIVRMAMRVHDTASMPEGRPPAAPVLVGIVSIEDEPAPFHLRVTELQAPAACHFSLVEGKVHMLGRVSVEVVDS